MIVDSSIDDEIIEDDFDIDDFDDDWDDDDADIDVDDINANDPVADIAAPSGEKSFLQKFFIPIVIAVVLIFAAIFFMGQGILKPASDNSATIAENTGEESDATTNASADTVNEIDAVMVDINEPPPSPLAEEAPLRPLPGDDESTQIELSDLEAELESTSDEILLDNAPDLVAGDLAANADIEVESLLADTSELPNDNAADILLDNGDSSDFTLAAEDAPLDDLLATENSVQDNADIFETQPVSNIDVSDAPLNGFAGAQNDADLQKLEGEIASLKNQNEDLAKVASESRETISSLNAEIASLKAMIETAKSDAQENIAPTKAVENAPVVQKPVQELETSPVVDTKPAARWVLKSAQPGKATIARIGSNDLKTIEIGSVVPGLGRITAIGVENGAWVVQGTKSKLSR